MDLFEDSDTSHPGVIVTSQEFTDCFNELTSDEKTYSQIQLIHSKSHSNVSVNISSEFKKVVVKRVIKNALQGQFELTQATQEIQIHKQLRHFNILNAIDSYETESELHLVTEYMNQADYFKNRILEQSQPITNELKLRSYLLDIAEGLLYLHSQGYVHSDLRIENLYCSRTNKSDIRTVKIADFGLLQTVGTPLTIPLKKALVERHSYLPANLQLGTPIDEKFDIFCLGVVLYQMCVAFSPSLVVNTPSYRGQIPIRRGDWVDKDVQLFKLVKAMLDPQPEKRPTVQQILDHPWLSF